ncbi:MAG: hypothetical protein KDE20_28760 [Caldilineaceae bacterium]|nr:hypothetical protein [Caldilineaceae bacterium]
MCAWRAVGYLLFLLSVSIGQGLRPVPAQATASTAMAAVSGTVWLDANNNGVWDSNDLPYAHCVIFLEPVEPEIPDVIRTAVAFSDEQGNFRFEPDRSGDYRLWAEMDEHLTDTHVVTVTDAVTQTTGVFLLMPPYTSYLPILAMP